MLGNLIGYLKRESAPGLWSFGMNRYLQGDFLSANKRFERAVRWRPGLKRDAVIMAYWRLSRYRMGETLDAISDFEGLREGLKAHPHRELAKRVLGEVEEILNDVSR